MTELSGDQVQAERRAGAVMAFGMVATKISRLGMDGIYAADQAVVTQERHKIIDICCDLIAETGTPGSRSPWAP